MGVWQGVAMDSLKFHPGLPCPTLLHPAGGLSLKPLTAVLWVALPQGGQPAVNFYPFRHPMPNTYGLILNTFKDQTQKRAHLIVDTVRHDLIVGFPMFVFEVLKCVHFQTKKGVSK
jgi:hypothetical protein